MSKLAYVCRSFYGTSETFIRDLAVTLDQSFDQTIFCGNRINGFPDTEALTFAPIRGPLWTDGRLARIKSMAKAFFGRCPFDEIAFRREERLVRRALFYSIRDFAPDHIYADYGTLAVHLVDIAKELDVPLVAHFHGYDASAALSNKFYQDGVTRMLKTGAKVIVPSVHMKRLLRIACGTDGDIKVIPYSPDVTKRKRFTNAPRSAAPTVSAVGRLTPKKNPLALIEAFALAVKVVPDAHLHLVGDGEMRDQIKRRVEEKGLGSHITLHGALQQEEAVPIIASSWVFAQHSVTSATGDQEGLPVAILEALALGVPVVSTIHSGIPEIVVDGENGFLVREHDYESMADRLVDVLRGNHGFSLKPVNFPPRGEEIARFIAG